MVGLLSLPLSAALATTYYVSPTGNDAANGRTVGTAWNRLDNGDTKGLLVPGDTVFALSGTYQINTPLVLSTDGTSANPIRYRCTQGTAVITPTWGNNNIVTLNGDRTVLDGFELRTTADNGVVVNGDSVLVIRCYIHDINKRGLDIYGKYAQIHFNVVMHCTEDCIEIQGGAIRSTIYNNTVGYASDEGIHLGTGTVWARVFNNIVVNNARGIAGHASNICAYNDVWNNFTANYHSGVTDSAGGISANPLFVNAAGGNYNLANGSPCINRGLYIGFPYSESAPDMGALESSVPVHLAITSDYDTLSADSSYQFEAVGIDSQGDTVETNDVVWSHTFASGTISAAGLFTGQLVGNGRVRATCPTYSLVDSTAVMTVEAGVLDTILVVSPPDTMTTDDTHQFLYSGKDKNGNAVTAFGTLSWLATGSIGTINSSGLLTAKRTGKGVARVTSSLGPVTFSDTIVVVPGALSYVDVAPADNVVGLLEDFQYAAYGYDADSNVIGNWTDSVTWSVVGGGSITAGGLYSSPAAPGDDYIHANVDLLHDSAHVNVSGALSTIRIENLGGVEIGDLSLTTDDDATVLYARAYTALDVPLGDVSVTWQVIGGDSIGYVTPVSGTSTTLVLKTPGSGRVTAVDAQDRRDTTGTITCTAGSPASIVISPDSIEVETDTTIQFTSESYDADGNSAVPQLVPTWSVTGGIGLMDAGTGSLSVLTAGDGLVIAQSGLFRDTARVTVLPGVLDHIVVSPDSVSVSADSTRLFAAVGYDALNNVAPTGTLTWAVVGSIGSIDASGLFTPGTAGTGRIAVTSSIGGVTDTSAAVVVVPGALDHITVTPDVATVGIYDTVAFSATGYDTKGNTTGTGVLVWQTVGRIGRIDDSGRFVASSPGAARVVATSSVGFTTDTSGVIDVEELYVTSVPIGSMTAGFGDVFVPLLIAHVTNYFDDPKELTSLTVRDVSRGAGTPSQIRGCIDSLTLYADTDNDSLLTAADSVLASVAWTSAVQAIPIDHYSLDRDSSVTLMVGAHVSESPRDSDTLDLYFATPTDLATADATVAAGPDSLNSLGVVILDGMVAAQITLAAGDADTLYAGDSLYHFATIDIPRNGYEVDTLEGFSIANGGTAVASDLSALRLYRDNGNGLWGGQAEESLLGTLVYTGGRWTVSGLHAALSAATTRFFIAAKTASYPTDNATIVLRIPVGGIEVHSANDGPIDAAVSAGNTIVIETDEAVGVQLLAIPAHTLIPGAAGDPVLGVEIQNRYGGTVALDSLRLKIAVASPYGDNAAVLLQQIDSLRLYLSRDGDISHTGAADSLLTSVEVTADHAVLDLSGLPLQGSGGVVSLAAVLKLSADSARNGNTARVYIESETHLYFSNPVVIEGTFPLGNAQSCTIDAFQSDAVAISAMSSMTYYGGQKRRPVFGFTLPADGYASASLKTVKLVNNGSVDDFDALSAVRLYLDDGDVADTAGDVYVGQFTYGSGVWQLTNLSVGIPFGGRQFVVAVDVSNRQFDGGTLDFVIPEQGVTYWSGTTGPDDAEAAASSSHLLFPADRITAISIPGSTAGISPGATNSSLLTFALYNGYIAQSQTFSAVTFTNISGSVAGADEADLEAGQLSLYHDADKNRMLSGDPLIAAGHFTDGKLTLSGLDIELQPEELSYFFVQASIPLDVIDADSLAIAVAQPSDFTFEEDVNINGDVPLTSGTFRPIDGSVAAQYTQVTMPARTLTPGDTDVPLFGFAPAHNGAMVDTLVGLRIDNTGDAVGDDFTSMALWLDVNADSTWQPGDSLLGNLIYSVDHWAIQNLTLPLTAAAPVLFVLGDIAVAATPGAVFTPQIPLNGCQYSSDNDGPNNVPLTGSNTYTISASGLRLSYVPLAHTYSVGQPIALRVTATNLLPAVMTNVVGEVVSIANASRVAPDSSIAGPVDLSAGESVQFSFFYTALDSGVVSWFVRALAPDIPDSSATVHTSGTTLQLLPSSIPVSLVSSMPTSVTRGQTNVFPLTIRSQHPQTSPAYSSYRLSSIRLSVEDDGHQPLAANAVFSRLSLFSGYTLLADLASVPGTSDLTFTFTQPVTVSPNSEMVLSVLANIAEDATGERFALSLSDASALPITDNNTGQTITLSSGASFPLRTEVCRVDDPSQQLACSYISINDGRVNTGQNDAGLARLYLRHPGAEQTSQVQLTGMSMQFVDDTAGILTANQLFQRVQLEHDGYIIGQAFGSGLSQPVVVVQLNAPLTLSPGETDSVNIRVDMLDDIVAEGFKLLISDSTRLAVRDLSSGSAVAAATDTLVIATGDLFPIETPLARVMRPAVSPEMCLTAQVVNSVAAGRDSLALADVELTNAGDSSHSAVRLGSILLHVSDSAGAVLDPNQLFDRIGYRIDGGEVVYQQFVENVGGGAKFDVSDAVVEMTAGQTHTVRLIADIEADTPLESFVLSFTSTADFACFDATDTTSPVGILVPSDCPDIPFAGGVTRVYRAAGRPLVGSERHAVTVAHQGELNVTLFDGYFDYNSELLLGDLNLNGVLVHVLKRTNSGYAPVAADAVFTGLSFYVNDSLAATAGLLTGDGVVFTCASPYVVANGDSVSIAVRGDVRADAPLGNVILRLTDSTAVDITDNSLGSDVFAINGGISYPIDGIELAVSANSLGESFVNFPNPFNPAAGDSTTIAFVLSEDAYVDLELFSITGDLVRVLADNRFRPQGTHQEDVWRGENDENLAVLPGVYFCRLTVRYVSGSEESVRRKIAVVR